MGFPAQLVVAKVVRPSRSVSLEAEVAAIRWAVDQGARDQPVARRPARPAAARPRHLLGARGGGDPLRVHQRRRGRRRGRERRPGADLTVALRELSGRAAARHRCERARARRRLRACVLEPRPDLQRHRGAGTGHRLDLSAAADQRPADVRRAGYSPCGPEEYRRAEDVLCRAAGCGYSGAPARDATDAPA